ncbi:hypothetical protein [Chryseobacterium oranimense]|uniref:hypothetical protein n=1 Tax=Chryseobacterium oranimense TaxID=421058 RepID=UPI0022366309|nr:hypothetical protein [Chryseobacterium oranimense]
MKTKIQINLKKLSRKEQSKITGGHASSVEEGGGTNNGGSMGNIVCFEYGYTCSQEYAALHPECCLVIEISE